MALEFPAVPLSYEDYAGIDDGNRYQVFDGELVLTPSPSARHQRIVLRIARALDDYAHAHGGEAFVGFSTWCFARNARRPSSNRMCFS
jgi:Uma2 family endonuclease